MVWELAEKFPLVILAISFFKSGVLEKRYVIKSYLLVAGSLGTSVFDSDVSLVGASGGVYALLAAHLANVLLVSCTTFI